MIADAHIAEAVLRHPRFNARCYLCHESERIVARHEREAGKESFQGRGHSKYRAENVGDTFSSMFCEVGKSFCPRLAIH